MDHGSIWQLTGLEGGGIVFVSDTTGHLQGSCQVHASWVGAVWWHTEDQHDIRQVVIMFWLVSYRKRYLEYINLLDIYSIFICMLKTIDSILTE